MSGRILVGDCRETLKTLPDKSVHMVVTSPPYFGLRNYNHDEQIGLEATPEEFIGALVQVFREVHRVLRDDGTLWLNIGDSYAGSRCGPQGKLGEMADRSIASQRMMRAADGGHRARPGAKQKDLIGIPWMLAFALRADGWFLRQDIIWSKPNPMPESVTDRCTKSHEYLFLLSKSRRYYFDAEAMQEPVAASTRSRLSQKNIANQAGSDRVPGKTNGMMKAVGNGETRNRRSVWNVATRPFKEAHFATYPPELIEPCILAGCPLGGTVLDPFFGAGTTGLVAQQHGRNWIGCELNEDEYLPIARRRLGLLDDDDDFTTLLGHNGGPAMDDDFEALLP